MNLQVHFKVTSCWKCRIFNNSSTFTYLYKFGQPKKYLKGKLFFTNLLEYILDMWLINIIVIKLKIILMLIIK
jgi:hypothetical protein